MVFFFFFVFCFFSVKCSCVSSLFCSQKRSPNVHVRKNCPSLQRDAVHDKLKAAGDKLTRRTFLSFCVLSRHSAALVFCHETTLIGVSTIEQRNQPKNDPGQSATLPTPVTDNTEIKSLSVLTCHLTTTNKFNITAAFCNT